jgi:hypothetical protein
MQDVLGFTAFQAGLGFLPMTAVNFTVATALPRIARRLGEAPTLVAGVALTLAGMGWLAQVHATSTYLTAGPCRWSSSAPAKASPSWSPHPQTQSTSPRVATAPTWGTGLLALCLAVVLAIVLPAQRRHRTLDLRRGQSRGTN